LGIDRLQLAARETPIEQAVSAYLGTLSFLWLSVEDEPGPGSERGFIERNTIALLSKYQRDRLDRASSNWLGLSSNRERVRNSGLWKQRHVDESCDPAFLNTLESMLTYL
jgi:hypothetical protein